MRSTVSVEFTEALFAAMALLVLGGVFLIMRDLYAREWRGWNRLRRARIVVLGGALFLFCLSAGDIATVWFASNNVNQALVTGNSTIIEGIPFKEWVTELGGGALLAVVGLMLDIAERPLAGTS